ncbi:MAG: hypothetical protein IKL24_02250 [Clostridia bacterium]|nr:hypothetical protein [Clostridia bacterium]
MKKLIALILSLLLVFSLAACGSDSETDRDVDKEKVEDKEDNTDREDKENEEDTSAEEDDTTADEPTEEDKEKPYLCEYCQEKTDSINNCGGYSICDDCYGKCVICDHCGDICGEAAYQGGYYYCEECRTEPEGEGECDWCEEYFEGLYSLDGYTLCGECIELCLICNECGNLTDDDIRVDDGRYCRRCYEGDGYEEDHPGYCYLCAQEYDDLTYNETFDIDLCSMCALQVESECFCFVCQFRYARPLDIVDIGGQLIYCCDGCYIEMMGTETGN